MQNSDGDPLNTMVGLMAHLDENAHSMNVHLAQTSAQPSPVASFRIIEAPIEEFEGRRNLLKEIHVKLQQRSGEGHDIKRLVALVAMGGMGKTETARKLALDYRGHYKSVAWIDAETEASTRESFFKIAETLKIPLPNINVEREHLASLVYRHISNHVKERSLIIFDNANQLKTDGNVFGILDYLPWRTLENIPLVLVTSQTTEWNQCAVIDVTELNKKESLSFLQSKFKLSLEDIYRDTDLGDLLDSLIIKLNGYPLALGLAAANIHYVPGEGSFNVLKQSLKEYIICVDDNRILEQRIDIQLAPDYPHTLLNVWNIAMENLEKRKAGREAKQLLDIIAFMPQHQLKESTAKLVYCSRNERFGVLLPRENDASFEEALHELETVGLARVGHRHGDPVIRVHRLIQRFASLEKGASVGIGKILLMNFVSPKFCNRRALTEECLWTQQGIPGWALENEWRTLLWLHSLLSIRLDSRVKAKSTDLRWKEQLGRLPNGADFERLVEFILNEFPVTELRRQDLFHSQVWPIVTKVIKLRQSLIVGSSTDFGVFLDFWLFLLAMRCVYIQDHWGPPERLQEPPNGLPRVTTESLTAWSSRIDFSRVLSIFPDAPVTDVMQQLIFLYRLLDQFYLDINIFKPKALFRLAEAKVAHKHTRREMTAISLWLLKELSLVWNPDGGEELVRNFNLLDHLSLALDHDSLEDRLQALGMIRQLVCKSGCAPDVVQHERLMELLFDGSVRQRTFERPKEHIKVYRYRSMEEFIYPGISKFESLLGITYYYGFIFYRTIIVCLALFTKLPQESGWTLSKTISIKKAKFALSFFATFERYGRHEVWNTDAWINVYKYPPFSFSKAELEEDQEIFTCAERKLKKEAERLQVAEWLDLMFRLVENLRRINRHFVFLLLEAKEGKAYSCGSGLPIF